MGNQPDGKVLSRAGPRPWQGLKAFNTDHTHCVQAPESGAGAGPWLEPQGQASGFRTHPGQCLASGEAAARGAVVRISLLDRPPPQPPTTPGGHGHRRQGPQPHALGSVGATPSPGRCDGYQRASGLRRGTDCRLWVEALGPNPALPAPFTGQPSQLSVLGTEEALGAWGSRCREAVWRTTFCVCLGGWFGGREVSSRRFRNLPSGSICRLCAGSALYSAIKPGRHPQSYLFPCGSVRCPLSHQIQATAGGDGVGRQHPPPSPSGTAPSADSEGLFLGHEPLGP